MCYGDGSRLESGFLEKKLATPEVRGSGLGIQDLGFGIWERGRKFEGWEEGD
jgi:hypothetical protein